MSTRIHIVLDEEEKERFRRQAEREGRSLAAWIREAAREKLEAGAARSRLETREELAEFFASCDRRETEPEPDWEEHREVIERSTRSGGSQT